MDPITTLTTGATLGQPVGQALNRLLSNEKKKYSLGSELKEAIERTLLVSASQQLSKPHDMIAEIVRHSDYAEIENTFDDALARMGSEDSAEIWHKTLKNYLDTQPSIDREAIDVATLAQDASEIVQGIIINGARKGQWPAIHASIVLSFVSSKPASFEAQIKHDTTQINNIWMLPALLSPVKRAEVEKFCEWLKENQAIHIVGPGGFGKTQIARQIITGLDFPIKWWFDGSSREKFNLSCEQFLQKFGIDPDETLWAKVKQVLSENGSWVVVIDDITDGSLIYEVLPGHMDDGRLVTTSRTPVSLPKKFIKHLSAPDDEVIIDLLASNSDFGDSDLEWLDGIKHVTNSSPLLVTALARYQYLTTLSWPEVIQEFSETPHKVYYRGNDPIYGKTIDDFISTSLAAAVSISEMSELVAKITSVAGGLGVPRILIDAAAVINELEHSENGIISGTTNASLEALEKLGLISLTDELVDFHKLYSDALLSRLEEQESEDLRLLIVRAIALLFNSPARPPENLAVFSSVLSNILGEADDLGSDGLLAQLLVARAHANLNQLITARRFYERIDDRLCDSLDGELITRTASIRADILILLGDYEAIPNLLDQLHSCEGYGDPLLEAKLLVSMAWYYEHRGDYRNALNAIDQASTFTPDNVELRVFRLVFDRFSPSSVERAREFLEAASDSNLDSSVRVFFTGQAALEFINLEMYDHSVRCAESALAASKRVNGPESVETARYYNDLGFAMLDAGKLDVAEQYLRESMRVYTVEDAENVLAAIPANHLSRVLYARSELDPMSAESLQQRKDAVTVIDEWIPRLRERSGESSDLATAVYTRGVALMLDEPYRAIADFEEALLLDRRIYGDGHIEVAKDLGSLLLMLVGKGLTGRAIEIVVGSYVHFKRWSNEIPTVSMSIVASALRLGRFGISLPADYPNLDLLESMLNAMVLDTDLPLRDRKQAKKWSRA